MTDLSYFTSRSGKLTCNVEVFFAFVTDLRNFERFIPEGSITNWKAEKESCSFNVSMLGNVAVRVAEKEEYKKVVFNGDALKSNDFLLTVDISENHNKQAEVKIMLSVDLNQMMKMMASKPISQFLEVLINEMERFNDWRNIKE
jgi:hypothetical protein